MATVEAGGGDPEANRKISLHPLAIVAVSDHSTGIQTGASTKPPGSKVLGILWGKQQGLQVAITDAVELAYELDAQGMPVIEPEAVNQQKSLYMEVYKGHEMLGWYSVGSEVTPVDTLIQQEFTKYNESPFFLLMQPSPDPEAKQLPLSLYESQMTQVNDEMKMTFVPCSFQLDTTQAERITMEAVSKASTTAGVSTMDIHVQELSSSLRSLASRVQILVSYLRALAQDKVQADHKLLREIASVCHQINAADAEELRGAFMSEFNDSLLINHLALITKSANAIGELSSKFSAVSTTSSHRF